MTVKPTLIGAPGQLPALGEEDQEMTTEDETLFVGACACCHLGPTVVSTTVRTKAGRVLRYNFGYRIEAVLGPASGLHWKLLASVPKALEERGLQAAVWKAFTSQLRSIDYKSSLGGCLGEFFCCFIGVHTLFCCCSLCTLRKRRVGAWDAEFRRWQADFNEILEPLGIFVKSRSVCNVGREERQSHVRRWLAFALGSEQVEKLKGEPHVEGDTDDWSLCGGINESELCMHPGY